MALIFRWYRLSIISLHVQYLLIYFHYPKYFSLCQSFLNGNEIKKIHINFYSTQKCFRFYNYFIGYLFCILFLIVNIIWDLIWVFQTSDLIRNLIYVMSSAILYIMGSHMRSDVRYSHMRSHMIFSCGFGFFYLKRVIYSRIRI